MMNKKWMLLAQKVSKGSDDNSTKVGAVIIKNNKIVATGFNHWDEIVDKKKRIYLGGGTKWLDSKYPYIIHAEMDAYANACKSKQSLEGCDLYVTLLPCNECAKNIVRAGVKKIYYLEDKHPEQEVFIASKKYFKLLGKKVTLEQIKL